MTSSFYPSLAASPIPSRNGSNASFPDDDTFGAYQTYDIKSEWGSFPGGPQPNTADYLEYQALYNNYVPNYEQTSNHTPWVSEDQEDPAFNHEADLDASSTFKESSEAPIQQGANFSKSAAQKNFVRKLYDMLDDKSSQKYIRWNPDGKSFIIENQDDFAKNVLERYLKTGNFQSFIRQLNMYDFHKTNKALRAQRGVQVQAQQFVFSHPKFQRGKLELLLEIKRKGTEQQDPPPQYETVSSGARFWPSLAQGHLPLPSSQFEYQTRILLQAENERLRKENEALKAAFKELLSEHNSLKASLRVGTSVLMPQAQNEPSSTALTTHSTFLDVNTSNQAFDLTHDFGFNYIGSPPEPVEGPVVFPQYTGATVQSTSNNQGSSIMSTPLLPVQSRSLPGPSSTSALSPSIARIRPLSPEQSPRKERPTSWDEWRVGRLHLVGSQDGAGPSNSLNALPRDAHAAHNANYGKAPVGSRAQPVENSDMNLLCKGVERMLSSGPSTKGDKDGNVTHNENYGKKPFGAWAQLVMRIKTDRA